MASWVFTECGFKPLPPTYPRARIGAVTCKSSKVRFLNANNGVNETDLKFQTRGFTFNFREKRSWELGVSAPLRVASIEGENEERRETINNVEFNGFTQEEEPDFNPGAPPPFKLADIRAAIPKHCWVKDPWKSMSYVVRDMAVVFGMAAAAAYLNNWLVWPLYWAAQGTMFWALFVLGHDW